MPGETNYNKENTPSNLFQLQLNNTGKTYIHRFYRLGTFILIGNTIMCIIFNIYIGRQIWQASNYNDGMERLSLPDLFYNSYFIVYNFINMVSVYYYVRFTKRIRKSIDLNDENGMNLSFKYLYTNALLFAISLILSLTSELFYLVITINGRS